MPQWLISIPAFLVAIGLLVAVHEYGHFWVARRMGVRVLRYSLGFGPRLWGRTSARSGTEYRVSAVPLGGYVKMLDEREGEVAEADKPYAFNRAHPLRRIAIVAAGPGVNFLFAIVAYWLVLMGGVSGIKPVIAPVPPASLAASADLHAGDEITAVAGKPVHDWQDLRLTLIERALDGEPVALAVRGDDGTTRHTRLDLSRAPVDPETLFSRLGLAPYQPPATPRIAGVLDDSAAGRAGLKAGDDVESIDGQTLDSPQALVDYVKARPGADVVLRVRRNGSEQRVPVTLARAENDAGQAIGRLGARIGVDPSAWQAMRTTTQLGPLAAMPAAVARTWDMSALTLRMIARMITGDVSWRNVSGPIQIADFAGRTASVGPQAFISFLALISLSLAVLNLMPIPVLDGGHLLYYFVEWVRGRPLSDAVQAAGQQLGILALMMLMTLAFYNDIARLLG